MEIKIGDIITIEDEEKELYIDIVCGEADCKCYNLIICRFFTISLDENNNIKDIRCRTDARPDFKYYIKEIYRKQNSDYVKDTDYKKVWSIGKDFRKFVLEYTVKEFAKEVSKTDTMKTKVGKVEYIENCPNLNDEKESINFRIN